MEAFMMTDSKLEFGLRSDLWGGFLIQFVSQWVGRTAVYTEMTLTTTSR